MDTINNCFASYDHITLFDTFTIYLANKPELFNILTREDVFKYVKENYGSLPVYPFKKYPNYAALRHTSNGKWYGLVMNVFPESLGLDEKKEIDILNVKCLPDLNDILRNGRDILPAYHMNKEH